MSITIRTEGLALTDELNAYTMAKMEDTLRVFGNMNRETIRMDLLLSRHEEGAEVFRAKADIKIPGDHFFLEEEAADVHHAVTQLKHKVMKRVRRWREKVVDKHHKAATQP